MRTKPGLRDAAWMAVGAAALLAVVLLVLHFRRQETPSQQLALRTERMQLVDAMRLDLASASESEKSAVMAITDEDSQAFADQARTFTAGVEQKRRELGQILDARGTPEETRLLVQFSEVFVEFQRVDKDLLALAVKNTNLKAFGLAFGPAAEAIENMGGALSRLANQRGLSSANALKVAILASGARISGLRELSMLAPHIAEESDKKMDQMEAQIAKEDLEARKNLDELAKLEPLATNPDLETARSSYGRFNEIKAQIILLSRENTNVRSAAISLDHKRKVMLMCLDNLAALREAIEAEPVAGIASEGPTKFR